jgi:hypothetical protein
VGSSPGRPTRRYFTRREDLPQISPVGTTQKAIITKWEKDRVAVRRENERLMKRREMRRMLELEAQEVHRSSIYAINAVMRQVYEEQFRQYALSRRRVEHPTLEVLPSANTS